MVLLFEVSRPFQWRPKFRRYSHFSGVMWLWFRLAWLTLPLVEYFADLKVARAMRICDDGALKSLGADVCWVRRGQSMDGTMTLVDGRIIEHRSTIDAVSTIDGSKCIRTVGIEVVP